MSLQVDDIVNKDDNGSVVEGAVVTGVATATSFSGPLTGNDTATQQLMHKV